MQNSKIDTKIITQKPFVYTNKGENVSAIKKILLVVIGVFIGGINGLFGAGGGMLLVPALTLVLGLEQKRAHATAIAIILPLCAISSITYALKADFDWSIVFPTIVGVTLGGILGATLLKKMSNDVLTFIFYSLMLFAGLKMIF